MDAGQLVPDQLVIDLVKRAPFCRRCKSWFILDSFPHNTAQAVTLDSQASERWASESDAALLVAVEPEVIVERLSSRHTCKVWIYTAPAGTRTLKIALLRCISVVTISQRLYS